MHQKFVGKVKYTFQKPDGSFKKVSEEILLEAVSFTDAEAIITAHYRGYKLLIVEAINKVQFDDLFLTDPENDDEEVEEIFVLAKIKANVLDLDSEKEKPVGKRFLIRTSNIELVNQILNDRLNGEFSHGWQLLSLTKTPYVNFLPINSVSVFIN